MTKEQIVDEIVKYCIDSSQEFFPQVDGELLPHGVIMKNDQSLLPCFQYYEEDLPTISDFLKDSKKSLTARLNEPDCMMAAICYLDYKKFGEYEYDLLTIEIIFKDDSDMEMIYIILDIDHEKHVFDVIERVDANKL
ncbi:MAG: hypothetical protein K0S32_4003 [Bacteroidetes bacterium]|jgi:hypothetical protein|nr:hypothetical protein [Bacteroidota bacterium]